MRWKIIQMIMKITILMLQPLLEVQLLSPYACQGYVKGCNIEIKTIIIETNKTLPNRMRNKTIYVIMVL